MAQVNPLTRELLVKLVYYGPGLGGKTTSLTKIHAASPPETRGQIVSLATPVDRTLYFDFLPLRSTSVRGHHVRLQLFTVPGQVYFNATRKLVLTGADGVVFVADSQRGRHDANLESMENLAANLEEQGRSIADVPLVLQYNKRDIPGVMSLEELDAALNPDGAPSFPTSAAKSEGVLEALDKLVHSVLEDLERRRVLGDVAQPTETPRFVRTEAALEEQIGAASEQIWRSTVEHAFDAPPAAARTPVVDTADDISIDEAIGSEPPIRRARMPVGPSWATLFGDDSDSIRAIERDLVEGRYAEAVGRCDPLVETLLLHTTKQAVLGDGALGAAALLLGIDGARWVGFRRTTRRARSGGPIDLRDALEAFAFLLDVRLRRDRLLIA